jgi:hypothetical protein
MSFFKKLWGGIKNIGSKIKEGTKWLGEKAKDIYSKGKDFVESNPVVQKLWNTIRSIEIPKLGISAGSLMDTIKGSSEIAHDTITRSEDIGDVISGVKKLSSSIAPVIPEQAKASIRDEIQHQRGDLSQRLGKLRGRFGMT